LKWGPSADGAEEDEVVAWDHRYGWETGWCPGVCETSSLADNSTSDDSASDGVDVSVLDLTMDMSNLT
jgi:hypothetical protein